MPQAFPCNIHQTLSTTCPATFSGIGQAFPCGNLPALLPQDFPMTLPPAFPATFIWNGDLPSQGIVRQVGYPNGSISLPSAQPTCPTDMRGWWVGVQMIVTSLMNYLQALPCGILPALLPRFSRDIATSFSRDIHLERGHVLSGHCEAGRLSQWKHFPSICTAIMPHRYAWQVGGCADDCHEPNEIFESPYKILDFYEIYCQIILYL